MNECSYVTTIIVVDFPQNQLLTKGMVILRDKIRYYEGRSGLTSGACFEKQNLHISLKILQSAEVGGKMDISNTRLYLRKPV